ncbi:MAG TPA: hypothetical protein DEH10_20610 [Pseudomonas sp.]|nr:hypothetical protein [Pseudomonas sp.]
MSDFTLFSRKSALVVLVLVMLGFMILNLVRFYGVWRDFFTVMFGQAWFGYSFYAFVSGRYIPFSGGATVGKDENLWLRAFSGGLGLLIYFCFFFYKV